MSYFLTQSQADKTFLMSASAAGTNAKLVKSGAGCVGHVSGYNASSSACYLKLYDADSLPIIGLDKPFWGRYLAGSSDFDVDLNGLNFSRGIGIAFVLGAADGNVDPIQQGDIMYFALTYC